MIEKLIWELFHLQMMTGTIHVPPPNLCFEELGDCDELRFGKNVMGQIWPCGHIRSMMSPASLSLSEVWLPGREFPGRRWLVQRPAIMWVFYFQIGFCANLSSSLLMDINVLVTSSHYWWTSTCWWHPHTTAEHQHAGDILALLVNIVT